MLIEETGLLKRDIDMIIEAVNAFPEVAQLVLFGSRAEGCHKKGSDVDLALKGKAVSYDSVLRLGNQLNEEMALPYFFDLVDYHCIRDQVLITHIDTVGIVLFDRDALI